MIIESLSLAIQVILAGYILWVLLSWLRHGLRVIGQRLKELTLIAGRRRISLSLLLCLAIGYAFAVVTGAVIALLVLVGGQWCRMIILQCQARTKRLFYRVVR